MASALDNSFAPSELCHLFFWYPGFRYAPPWAKFFYAFSVQPLDWHGRLPDNIMAIGKTLNSYLEPRPAKAANLVNIIAQDSTFSCAPLAPMLISETPCGKEARENEHPYFSSITIPR